MKTKSTFQVLAFFMAVLMFSAPFVTLANEGTVETSDVDTAEGDAKRDANTDVNKRLWIGLGGLLSALTLVHDYGGVLSIGGLAGTYFYRPNPPTERFVGKSLEYVNVYSETYKKEVAKLQATWSAAGCLGGGVIITGFALVGFVRLGIAATANGE